MAVGMIRMNLKVLVVLLFAAVFVSLSLWTRCGEVMLAGRSRRVSGQAAEWDIGNKKVLNGQVICFTQKVFNLSIVAQQHDGIYLWFDSSEAVFISACHAKHSMKNCAEWKPSIVTEIQDAWRVTFWYLITTCKVKWNVKWNPQNSCENTCRIDF